MPISTTGADSVTDAKGMAAAEISRGFFGVQLAYAGALSDRARLPLADAITFHTNFHRLFAYGNLRTTTPDPAFLGLVREIVATEDHDTRLDRLVTAYAARPIDPWPADRFQFGKHFACEAPNADGIVRIHFRNRANSDDKGPLDVANIPQRRADLAALTAHVAKTWPETKAINGASWLYNLEAYRRLFPRAYADSRAPYVGPRPTHGLSTWGQFLDFRGAIKPQVVDAFREKLPSLDPVEPWRVFPYAVLTTTASLDAFRREYGV